MVVPKIPLQLTGQLERYHHWWWSRQIRRRPIITDWNRQHSAIFVHIPKTAGTTVIETLGAEPVFDTHAPAGIYREADARFFERAFKFAFVRNPWDRLASSFHFMKSGTDWPMQQQWARRHIGDRNFAEFLRALRNPWYRTVVMSERFFWPQSFWLTDRRERLLVDKIYRFEEIESAMPEICDQLGVDVPQQLPTRRHSKRLPYSELYDQQSAALVGRLYARDVEAFGYSFLS